MKKVISKCGVLFIISFIYLLTLPMFASADTGVKRLFGKDFVDSCQLPFGDVGNGLGIAVLGNSVYQLMVNGDIYVWEQATGEYSYYSHVPAEPFNNVEIPLDRQPESVQQEMRESVSRLIPSDEGLYGFNYTSGKVGLIDQEGWHPLSCKLDVSGLFLTTDNYPRNLRNTFICEGKLYAFHDINLTKNVQPNTQLLIFDLSTGGCTTIPMPFTITFCQYTPGKLLCMQSNEGNNPSLSIYDINSQCFTPLSIAMPLEFDQSVFSNAWHLRCMASGLAYDVERNIIYLADANTLWRSIDGTPFVGINLTNGWMQKMEVSDAWVLTSGGYIIQNGWPYYVVP